MKYLLDTHILLWAAYDDSKLSQVAREIIQNEGNELLFSAASIWEIAIKSSLGREDFSLNPALFRRGLLDNGYSELAVTGAHATMTHTLADIHKDPFDRMLVAQSLSEGIALISADKKVAAYSDTVILV